MIVIAPDTLTPWLVASTVKSLPAPALTAAVVNAKVLAPEPALLNVNGPEIVASANVTAGALPFTTSEPNSTLVLPNVSARFVFSVAPANSVNAPLDVSAAPAVEPDTASVPAPVNVRLVTATTVAPEIVSEAEPEVGATIRQTHKRTTNQ